MNRMHMQAWRRRAVLGAALSMALSSQGCIAVARRVLAPRETVVVQPAPPPLRAEVMPPPPAFDAYWVHGYWRWIGGEYVWAAGHWTLPRPAEVLVRARWELQGGRWVFVAEHWVALRPPAGAVAVVTAAPPPLPRVEVMPAPPSAEYFWIAGYWRWDGLRYVWVEGRWELRRAGAIYVRPYWIRAGAGYRLVGGYWQ